MSDHGKHTNAITGRPCGGPDHCHRCKADQAEAIRRAQTLKGARA